MKEAYIFSPVPFYLFGIIYYFIIPFVGLNYFQDLFLVQKALEYINLSFFDERYLIDLFLIFFSWYFGYKFFYRLKFSTSFLDKMADYRITPVFLSLLLFIILILVVFNAIKRGVVFFSGYSVNYDVVILGQFSTLIFMSAFFVNFFNFKSSKRKFMFLFFISSVIMLGLGSRMFFLLGLITLFLGYLSNNIDFLKSVTFYIILGLVMSFVIFIGIWRSGEKDVSVDMFISIFIIEPIFTLVSAFEYINNNNGRPITGYPNDILAAILNFIPTIFFEKKIDIIKELTKDVNKDSPFGASSLIVNLYSNFGYFYPVFLFFIGSYVGALRKRAQNSIFYRSVYFSILPIFMFHFYREGFITVIKILFFNSFILPFVLLFLFFDFKLKPRF